MLEDLIKGWKKRLQCWVMRHGASSGMIETVAENIGVVKKHFQISRHNKLAIDEREGGIDIAY